MPLTWTDYLITRDIMIGLDGTIYITYNMLESIPKYILSKFKNALGFDVGVKLTKLN